LFPRQPRQNAEIERSRAYQFIPDVNLHVGRGKVVQLLNSSGGSDEEFAFNRKRAYRDLTTTLA
jgi:hypothetical protein